MADERYFGGNSLAAFFRSASTVVDGSTTSGRFDSTFVSNAITFTSYGEYIETPPFVDATSTTTLWLHFELYTPNDVAASGSAPLLRFYNASGTEVVRLDRTATLSGLFQWKYWNGSAMTNLGSSFTFCNEDALSRFDIRIVTGASGTIDVWRGGTQIFTDPGTGLNAAVGAIAKARLYQTYSAEGSERQHFSQIMGANFDTRDSRWYAQYASALGGATDGSGAASDINEAVLDETTSAALSTSGHKRSFTHSSLTLPAGYQIGAVGLFGRGRINGTGPSDGKFGLRKTSTSTNYSAASGLNFNSGYEPRGRFITQDPSTASDWTQSGYNDVELLLEAV